jgi:hypothetical protein
MIESLQAPLGISVVCLQHLDDFLDLVEAGLLIPTSVFPLVVLLVPDVLDLLAMIADLDET